MTLPDLSTLESLARAATPGPWTAERDGSNHRGKVYERSASGVEMIATVYCGAFDGHGYATSEYIAAAHPGAVLALIEEVRTLRDRLNKWESIAERDHGAEFDVAEAIAAYLEREAEDRRENGFSYRGVRELAADIRSGAWRKEGK